MFKKLASIALAATMLTGTAAIAASAAETTDDAAVAATEQAAVGADDSSVGADDSSVGADSSSEVGSGNVINFDANSTGWKNFKYCMCYIYEYAGDAFKDWGVKATRMKDDDGDGVWTYDLDKAGITLDSSKYYGVLFSNDVGMQTADLLLTTKCFGDTAYVKDQSQKYENTSDSNKSSNVAYWKSNTDCQPMKLVTSIGNIVGEQICPADSAYGMFVKFLKDTLNAEDEEKMHGYMEDIISRIKH